MALVNKLKGLFIYATLLLEMYQVGPMSCTASPRRAISSCLVGENLSIHVAMCASTFTRLGLNSI